ncbi:hypothetical protein BLA29_014058 [Euroglyphus maynei]|uniref:Uncharacterized protein n=1 Tax=Euroglyphus maynei TaxID=6958 RepID=A0A1Y3B2A1_EURMA|nr:hypothetical protein BLA29_014058 [Euroglyphus maynei]
MPLWIECGRYSNRNSTGETMNIDKALTNGKTNGDVGNGGNNNTSTTTTVTHHLHGAIAANTSVGPFYRQFVS